MRASRFVVCLLTVLSASVTLAQTPAEWTTPSTFGPTEPPPPPADVPPPPPVEPAPAAPTALPPPAPIPAPAPAPPTEAPSASTYRTSFHLVPAIGVAVFSVSDAWTGFGALLEGTGEFRFNPWVGLKLRASWALTEWDRTLLAIQHGVAAGSWTAGAFSTVGQWLVSDKAWFLLKLFPALFAFTFLTFGFMYAGLVFLLSPFAATSYIQLGVAASGHLPLDNGVDLFAEAGLGAMMYWHPRTQFIRMAFGPTLGVGLTVRRISVAVHGMWSPPVMQSNPTNAPDVVGAHLTVGYMY